MRNSEDTRTLPQKAADLELAQIRIQLMDYGKELEEEGESQSMIVGCFCADLGERLARLYCMYYELSAEMEACR